MPRTWVRPASLLTGLRNLSVDLRVDTDVVEGPGQDRHHDRRRLGAAADGAVVVAALPGRNRTDNEPDNEKHRSESHWSSAGAAGPIREMSKNRRPGVMAWPSGWPGLCWHANRAYCEKLLFRDQFVVICGALGAGRGGHYRRLSRSSRRLLTRHQRTYPAMSFWPPGTVKRCARNPPGCRPAMAPTAASTWTPRGPGPYPTCCRPPVPRSRCCSAASPRACTPPPPATTWPAPATGSGPRCTAPASRPGNWTPASRTCWPATDWASPTWWPGPPPRRPN